MLIDNARLEDVPLSLDLAKVLRSFLKKNDTSKVQ